MRKLMLVLIASGFCSAFTINASAQQPAADKAIADAVIAMTRAQWAAGIKDPTNVTEMSKDMADDYTEFNGDFATRVDGKALNSRLAEGVAKDSSKGTAAEIEPDNAALQATVGFGYINLDRSREAIEPLSRAARLAPKDYLVHSQLGFALYAAGKSDAAITELRRGAALKPRYGPVWLHLGLVYQHRGQHREALQAFQTAARLMPENRRLPAYIAQTQRALGGATTMAQGASHPAQKRR